MKLFLLLILMMSLPAIAQSSYSAADQGTEVNKEASQGDTGYVNKDLEKTKPKDVKKKEIKKKKKAN